MKTWKNSQIHTHVIALNVFPLRACATVQQLCKQLLYGASHGVDSLGSAGWQALDALQNLRPDKKL